MNNKIMKGLRGLALIISGGAMLFACKEDPVKPENEILKKLHENPAKITYTLTEASLPAGTQFTYANIGAIALGTKKQTITFEYKPDKSFGPTEESPKAFTVKNVAQDPTAVYYLTIQYYSPSGQPMNNQFIENSQDRIHQHFFSIYKNGLLVTKADQIPYSYLYADKDAKGVLYGEKNPIGMEGYLRFDKAIGEQKIVIDLIHFYKSKYKEGGGTSPYYAADRKNKSESDVDASVGIVFSDGTGGGSSSGSVTVPIVSTEKPTGKFPGINNTDVRKIVLGMYEGHIHEPANYHYVPGPVGFNSKNLSMEQEMTIEYKGGEWVVTKGVNFFLFSKGQVYKVPGKKYTVDPIPAPVYGLWVEYYDGNNRLINGTFAESGAYQTFFRPNDIKKLSTGEAVQVQPKDLFGYMYRDTEPWNKANRDGARYIDDKDPKGLKGFFYFNQVNRRFALNMELWHTPSGKLTGDKPSPFYEPSAHVQKTGRPVLTVSIPAYVWLDREFEGKIEEDVEINSFKDVPDSEAVLKSLCRILNLEWSKVLQDLVRRVEGERGGESEGKWF